MIRRIVLALLVIVVAATADMAAAQPISRNNPYRSFNITGINYGSMQWERDHRGSSGDNYARPRRYRRR